MLLTCGYTFGMTSILGRTGTKTMRRQLIFGYALLLCFWSFVVFPGGGWIKRQPSLVGHGVPGKVRMPSKLACTPDSFLLYNKPYKTGSTTIRNFIVEHEKKRGGRVMDCAEFYAEQSDRRAAGLPASEALWNHSFTASVCHFHSLKKARVREAVLRNSGRDVCFVTSTREPRSRILSSYMQKSGLTAKNLTTNTSLWSEFEKFVDGYDIYSLHNYHGTVDINGKGLVGDCGSVPQRNLYEVSYDLARSYDVVLENDNLAQDLQTLREVRYPSVKLLPLRANNVRATDTERTALLEKANRKLDSAICAEAVLHGAMVAVNLERRRRGEW